MAVEDPPDACSAVASRRVAPEAVALGGVVTVTTHIAVRCAEPLPLDVALVVDRSPSMRGSSLADAKAAASAFIALRDPLRVRVGIVTFSSTAEIAARLSRDARYLGGALRAIEVPERGGTDIQDGLWVAGRLLAADGDGRAQAIVLISDGRNNAGPLPVAQQAAVQREAGRHIVTVALGIQADIALMGSLASTPEDALIAPRSDQLVDRLERVAARLAAVQARALVAVERPAAGTRYDAGSAQPSAEWNGTILRWRVPIVPSAGVTVLHRVHMLAAGWQPVSDGGLATYERSGTGTGSVALPPASVWVWDAGPTSQPPPEPTATRPRDPPEPTATPSNKPPAPTEPRPGPPTQQPPTETPQGNGRMLYLPVLDARTGPPAVGRSDPPGQR